MRSVLANRASKGASKIAEERRRQELKREIELRSLILDQLETKSIEGGRRKSGETGRLPKVSKKDIKDGYREIEPPDPGQVKGKSRKKVESGRKENIKGKLTPKSSATRKQGGFLGPQNDVKKNMINDLFQKGIKSVPTAKASSDSEIRESHHLIRDSNDRVKDARKARSDVRDQEGRTTPQQKLDASDYKHGTGTQTDQHPKATNEFKRYAFLRNVRPSKQELAMRYAKPVDLNVLPRKPTEQSRYAKECEQREHATEAAPESARPRVHHNAAGIDDLETSRVVSSLRCSREKMETVPWLLSLLVSAAIVFAVAVFIICVDVKYVIPLLAIPLLEKSTDCLLRRIYRTGFHQMKIEDVKNKDFMRRLVREIEARTTAKVKRQIINSLTLLE